MSKAGDARLTIPLRRLAFGGLWGTLATELLQALQPDRHVFGVVGFDR